MPVFPRTPRLAALLALAAVTAVPARATAHPSASLTLRVSPNPTAPSQELTITLSGARPGQPYVFTAQPLCVRGFGGGLLGRWTANRQGVVHLHYPAPTSPDPTCQWRLRAAPVAVGTGPAVSTMLTVRATAPMVSTAALRGQGNLAFTWGTHTYTVGAASKGAHRVANTAGSDLAWSADGRWLAYVQVDPTTYTGTALWLARADGSGAHKVPGLTKIGGFTWSPTGERLAIAAVPASQAKAASSVWLASPTTAPRLLVAGAGGPTWSPDGKLIAFAMVRPGPRGAGNISTLATIPVGGGPMTTYTNVPNAGITFGGWWPNSQGMLYMVDPFFSGSIAADGLPLYSVPLHGTARRLLTTLGYKEWIAWAPHSTRFLVVAGSGREIWTGKSLRLCDAATGACPAIAVPKGMVALDPAWSPDGKRIAYVTARDAGNVGGFGSAEKNAAWVGTRVLWIAEPMGTQAHQMRAAGTGIYQPTWARDSSALFYLRGNTLWRVGVGGGAPTRVVGPFPTAPLAYPYGYYGHLSWVGQIAWQGN